MEKKGSVVSLRLSDIEMEILKKNAQEKNMTHSNYIRNAILNDRVNDTILLCKTSYLISDMYDKLSTEHQKILKERWRNLWLLLNSQV